MEDRRIKRTKRFLSMALVELLAEKPVNEITVKELTERSDVNRATFYRHYRDIYDMLRQLEQELVGEFTAALGQEPPPENEAALERLYCRILRFVADRAELCGILFGPNGDRSLLRRLEMQVLAYCGIRREAGLDTVERFLATFLVSGFINVVEQWLSEGMRLPPEQLASSIMRATREGFSLGLCPLVRNLPDSPQA